MIITNSGIVINVMGNFIHCSNGKTYTVLGNILQGSGGIVSRNVRSVDEAVSIIVGMYGGKRM